jgi:hypothetical protein
VHVHHGKVLIVVDKSKAVESHHVATQLLVLKLVHLLVVDLLGSQQISKHGRRSKNTFAFLVGNNFINIGKRRVELVIMDIFDNLFKLGLVDRLNWVLRDHLGHLNELFDRLSDWLNNTDVSPDLVTKADAVASLHTVESGVATGLGGCG